MSWLRVMVPYEGTTADLADRLSLTGLAVDAILRPGAEVSGVIAAEVRHVEKHPDADKLHLVKAFDGKTERHIVCGASNYAVGDLVPLAVPGAVLPGGFEISSRKVRGEVSDGMLCSAKELGLGADHSGILILGEDEEPGADLVNDLGLDDEVLDIDVLPNRPDALSILGVAREVAAIWGLDVSLPELTLEEEDEDIQDLISIEVLAEAECPRYTARILRGATTRGLSPWWLRRRLILCGMRPIDPIVDATNHQMLEIGQPLHAFDLAQVRGGKIRVRTANKDETLETLDGQTRRLVERDLLICDADRPIALAGVMGGADSEVSAATTDVLLESATFEAMTVARTSRRMDLRSEAAQRFERGVDPAIVEVANDRCAALIAALTGAKVVKGRAAGGPGPEPRPRIVLSGSGVSRVLGSRIDAATAEQILVSLGAEVERADDSLAVTPPSWRPDIRISADVIEEIARMYGYDRIGETLPHGGRVGGLPSSELVRRKVMQAARGAGCDEAMTLSLLSPKVADALSLPSDHPWRRTVALANPLSEEESRLRPSLLPGLIETARRNVARRALAVRLVETGTVFSPRGEEVQEDQRVAVLLTGDRGEGWHAQEQHLDLFDARTVLDQIADALGTEISVEPMSEPSVPYHPGRSARVVVDGRDIGVLAELHPDLVRDLELPQRVAVFEIDLAPLVDRSTEARAPELSRFPAITRDLALEVPADIPSAEVLAVVSDAGGDLTESVRLFDRYAGAQVAEGRVSLAMEISIRAMDRTLTDEEAAQVMGGIEAEVSSRGWLVRG